MNTQALPEAFLHFLMVLFIADFLLLIFAGLLWSLVHLRQRARWQRFYTGNAKTKNPALEKAVDEIVAAQFPTLAGR